MMTIPGLFVGESGFLALLATWRGEAWSHAQQLAAATTPAVRQLVVDQIEGVAQTSHARDRRRDRLSAVRFEHRHA